MIDTYFGIAPLTTIPGNDEEWTLTEPLLTEELVDNTYTRIVNEVTGFNEAAEGNGE
jgi:hypothetical protein